MQMDPETPFEQLDGTASFRDHSIRLAIGEYDSLGSLTYGPLSTTVEGHSYEVILDYINVDATHIAIHVRRYISAVDPDGNPLEVPISLFDSSSEMAAKGSVHYEILSDEQHSKKFDEGSNDRESCY